MVTLATDGVLLLQHPGEIGDGHRWGISAAIAAAVCGGHDHDADRPTAYGRASNPNPDWSNGAVAWRRGSGARPDRPDQRPQGQDFRRQDGAADFQQGPRPLRRA